MRNWLVLLFILATIPCFAVHNFTVNGVTSVSASVGDSLHIQFDFETVGGAADYSITIEMMSYQIPLFTSTNQPLADGGAMDETGVDGVFEMTIPLMMSLPEEATTIVTLTDDGVSATVELHCTPLNSTYSIAGTVEEEGSIFNLPVPYALVYSFYNTSPDTITSLLGSGDPTAILEFMAQNHYLISDASSILGQYQIKVPDDLPGVPCTVGVYSIVDYTGGYVAPDWQVVTVNGAETGINFLYREPDGTLSGTITDGNGNPLGNTFVTLQNEADSLDTAWTIADSLGQYQFSLLTGTYTLTAVNVSYSPYQQTVDFTGGNLTIDIVLSGGTDSSITGIVTDANNTPLAQVSITFTSQDVEGLVYEAITGNDGTYSVDVQAGAYHYYALKSGYAAHEGNVAAIGGSPTVLDINLGPVSNGDASDPVAKTALRTYPNPFNPCATVEYSLAQPGKVKIEVFNARGQKVTTLLQGNSSAGTHYLTWNGTDDQGQECFSGVYILRMVTGGRTTIQKTMLLK